MGAESVLDELGQAIAILLVFLASDATLRSLLPKLRLKALTPLRLSLSFAIVAAISKWATSVQFPLQDVVFSSALLFAVIIADCVYCAASSRLGLARSCEDETGIFSTACSSIPATIGVVMSPLPALVLLAGPQSAHALTAYMFALIVFVAIEALFKSVRYALIPKSGPDGDR